MQTPHDKSKPRIYRDQLITNDDLQEFKTEILQEIKILITQEHLPAKRWLKTNDLKKLLRLSHGTLQHMRESGQLPYTRIGGVLYYDYEDVQKMLKNNKFTK